MTGASRRPADVVALRVDRIGEVDERLGVPEQRPDPPPPRQQLRSRGRRSQVSSDAPAAPRQDAELRLVELVAVEGEVGDEQRDGEADPGDRAAAGDRRPADRRAEPAAAAAA